MFKQKPSDRWTYAAILAFTGLGFSLLAFGGAPEVVAAGLLLLSVVAAALAASLGARRVSDAAARRLALAVLFALVMVPPALFLVQQSSAVEVTLRSIEPRAGAPMTLTEPVARDAGQVDTLAPISAAFSSLEVAVEPPPSSKPKAPAQVLIVLPIRADDCRELETRLEGSCGQADLPGRLAEPLTIESLNSRQSLVAEVDPEGVRSLELGESTPRSQADVPVEWSLAGAAGTIELEVRCSRGTDVVVIRLPSRALARCGSREARFHIPLAPPPGSGLSVFLNELSEFHVGLGSERVQAEIEAGHLKISDASRDLPQGPVPIDFEASAGHSVYLDIDQSVDSGQNGVSLESDRVDRVEISGQDERRSWPQQNTNLVWLVFGLIAAALVPAVLELVLRLLNK